MVDTEELRRAFLGFYGKSPRLFAAPGRVNLIGEHTDYNEGFVLPMAVNRRTFVAAAPRTDRRVRARSLDLKEVVEFDLNEQSSVQKKHWSAYLQGVARVLEEVGINLTGADIAIASDVPIGAGLSSSAALEISVGMALATLAGVEPDRFQLALAGQRAEHVYVGTRCGVMDQLVVALAQKDHALLIDCRSLETTPIKLNLTSMEIVVCNTRVKHDLAVSAYNERREECERGVEILRERIPGIRSLRDVSLADFDQNSELLPEPIRRRCQHVVTENGRTLLAAEALKRGDVRGLGELMSLSHQSLRDDYEVSCAELDKMVELATHEGAYGARMTGGGFGGCTVNLVRQDVIDSFSKCVSRSYHQATGIVPEIYLVHAEDGVCEITAVVSSEAHLLESDINNA